jgi:hypothetical protein
MRDLTAIDILVDPDGATVERARAANARMRRSVASGFALDATHQPHITTLQRYVRTADLGQVYASVETTIAQTDVASLAYEAVAMRHADWGIPGEGLAVFVLRASPGVLDLQARLLATVTPFVESGGTAAAFVRDPGEDISQSTRDWVEGFVPAQIGSGRYIPHITVGFATLDDLKAIESESFHPFDVHPVDIAIFHLGNSGTARTQLKAWRLASSPGNAVTEG